MLKVVMNLHSPHPPFGPLIDHLEMTIFECFVSRPNQGLDCVVPLPFV
jgi:hypothetical protein